MRTPHITRKELKQDELSEAGRSLFEWFEHNRNRILGALIVILVIVGGYRVTNMVIERRKAQAARDLAEARMAYMSASAIVEPEQRQEEIDRTLELCGSLEANYGSARAGREATYLIGNCHYLAGRYDEAEEAFRDSLQKAANDEEKARALIALGNVYEDRYFENPDDADLMEQARDAYARAAKLGTKSDGKLTYQGVFAMIEQGRLETVNGNYEKALEIYRTIEEKRSTDERFEDDVDLAQLEADSDGSRADQGRIVAANIREIFRRYSLAARAEGHINELQTLVEETAAGAETNQAGETDGEAEPPKAE